MVSTYTCAQLHQQQQTDSVNGQIYSNTFHARYSRAPHTSQVKLTDQVLPLDRKPEVLGVTLDTHLTFTQHCNNVAVKVQQRNNVLKALTDSTWGCFKEILLTTCQAIGRTIISYCCPVWTPSPGDTNRSRIQRAQNSTLRITTDCLKMADVAEEARELPVRQLTCRFPSSSP